MLAALQLLGAVAVLSAFVAVQLGRITPASVLSLALNLAGSIVLAALALHEQQWGFVLLESVWAVVSGYGLARRVSGPGARTAA